MARMIPAAERIIRARALIQKARDLVKFIPYTPTAAPETKAEVKAIFQEADQANQELLHR